MTTLFDENRFESAIDSKIIKQIQSEKNRIKMYNARVVRRDADGVWWVRIFGASNDTPVIVNKLDMSVDDIVVIGIDTEKHITIADGNLTSPPMSAYNSQAYMKSLVVENLTATYAEINHLKADYAEITKAVIEDADITNARIHNLIVEATRQYNRIEANEAWINDLTAHNITTETITANIGKIKDIEGESLNYAVGYIADLTSENITTENLVATAGYIADLTSENITAQNIDAAVGYIGTLTSNSITAQDITSDHATIGSLDSTYATIQNLNAATGRITNLESTKADITFLESNYIDADTIAANYAQANLANVNNAWIQNGTIKDAAIGDAQILGVSANKLTTGRIDAGTIDVVNLRTSNLIVDKINGQPVFGDYTFVKPTSAGYENKNPVSEGWYEMVNGQFVLSTDTSVQDGKTYYAEGDYVALYDQDYIDGLAQNLNQRIDGAVETFTVDAVPTLLNTPTNGWAVSEYQSHVGDVAYVVNAASDADGYCYRFAYDNTTQQYMWVLIKDSDVTKALQDLIDAQGDINGLLDFRTNTISWQEDTDEELLSVKGRVSSVETSLGTKVSTTVFNEVAQRVDENVATITSFGETIRKGGRNLLLNGDFSKDMEVGTTINDYGLYLRGNTYTVTIDDTVKHGAFRVLKIVGNKAGAGSQDILWNSTVFSGQGDCAGTTLTFSFWAKADTSTVLKARTAYGSYIARKEVTVGTDWDHYEIVITGPSADDFVGGSNEAAQIIMLATSACTVYLSECQLEYGSVATAFSSAPEDITITTNTVNEVKQTADTNSASIRQVTEKVENLQVGGRNLLFLTRGFDFDTDETTGGYLSISNATKTAEVYDGLTVRYADYSSVTTTSYYEMARYNNVIVPKTGKTYTFGFYAKGSGELRAFFFPNSTGATLSAVGSQGQTNEAVDGNTVFTLSSDWKRYWVKWTVGGTQATATRSVLLRVYNGSLVHICGLMFEESDMASNWAPAPEDGENQITTLTTKTSEITQTLDGVKTVIGYSENTSGQGSSTLVTKVNTIDETVDGHTANLQSVRTTLSDGGRNLIGYASTYEKWRKTNNTVTFDGDEIDINVSGATSNTYTRAFGFLIPSNVVSGTYTLSFEVYCDDWSAVVSDYGTGFTSTNVQVCYRDIEKWAAIANTKRYWYGRFSTDSNWSIKPSQENGKWLKFVSKPLTLPDSLRSDASLGTAAEITIEPMLLRNGHVKFRHIKFEVGEIATAWSAAPEDFTSLSQDYANYKQTVNEFEATIGKTLAESVRNVLYGTVNPTVVTGKNWSVANQNADLGWYSYNVGSGTVSKTTDGVKFTHTATSASTGLVIPFVEKNPVKAGEKLTLSFEYRGTLTTLGRPYILNASGGNSAQNNLSNVALTGDGAWHTYTESWTAQRTTADAVAFLLSYTSNASAWLEVRDGTLMLEHGDVAKRLSTAETSISSNAEQISLRATKAEAYQMGRPNLSPFFEHIPFEPEWSGTSTKASDNYWVAGWGSFAQLERTPMGDGWMHVRLDNSSGTSAMRADFDMQVSPSVREGADYTFLFEFRNNTSTGNNIFYIVQTNNLQFWGGGIKKNLEGGEANSTTTSLYTHFVPGTAGVYTKRFVKVSEATGSSYWTNGSNGNLLGLCCLVVYAYPGSIAEYDVRVSLYEGEYTGPWKAYTGAQLYASQAELKVQSDRIGMVVSNADASSSLALTANAMTYIGNHVEIKNANGTSTVISGGKLQTNLINVSNMADANKVVKYTRTEYYLSTSQTSLAGGSWQSTKPTLTKGSYLWQRTALWYANNTATSYTTSNASAYQPDSTGVCMTVDPDIQIGGRNLLRGSSDLTKTTWWNRSGITSVTGGQADPDGGTEAALITPSATSWYLVSNASNVLLKNVGETYTVSIWLKAASDTTCKLCFRYLDSEYADSAHTTRRTVNVTTNWQRFSITGTLYQAQTADCFWIGQSTTVAIYAYHPQVEQGNQVTDWSPALEDIEADIAAVPGFKYLNSAYTNPMATVKGWAEEGKDAGNWTVTSTAGVRVGDTVYIKTVPSDNNGDPVYVIVTVTSITSATVLRGISHGYLDTAGTVRQEIITTVADFDDYKTTGVYYFKVGSNANAPKTNHGKLTVNFDLGTPYQIFEPDNLNYYYKRTYTTSSSTWSSWTEIDGKGAKDLANTANNKANAWRGTLGTDGSTAAKVVSCTGFTSSHLVAGTTISVYCASSGHNVSGAMTLNVEGTGAKAIYVNGAATSDTNRLYWTWGCTLTFTYDGTNWRLSDSPPAMYGKGYESSAIKETCETAEGTAQKNVLVDSFVCFKGATMSVPMKNSNTSTAMTIKLQNSSGTGFVANVYHGSSTNVPTKANGLAWPAGEAVIFTYDGKFWRTGNQTFIDGGNITTGTVAADRIAVSQIAIGNLNGASTVIANATNGNDALNKVNYYNRSVQVGQSTGTVSNTWYKFASTSVTGANEDYAIQFTVQAAGNYADTKRDGILRAHIRTNGSKEYSAAQLQWITKSTGIDLSHFVLAYKTTASTKVDVELWCKVETGWHGYQFFVDYEAKRTGIPTSALWTLHANWGQDKSTASITSGYTQITSTYIDSAATTATTYITKIDDNGIKVHAATGGTNNYAKIDANGLDVFNANTSVASFGSTARVGAISNAHVVTESNKIDFFTSNSTLPAVELANNELTFYGEAYSYNYAGLTKYMGPTNTRFGLQVIDNASSPDASFDLYSEASNSTSEFRTSAIIHSEKFSVETWLSGSSRNYFNVNGLHAKVFVEKSAGDSNDTGYYAKVGGNSVLYGYGSGAVNHGVFSSQQNRWLIHGDHSNNIYIGQCKIISASETATAANIRNNLGLGNTSGALPIANGGTGQTATTTGSSSWVTVNSTNATLTATNYAKWGKILQIDLTWTNKAAISVPANGNITNLQVCTLNSGYRPAVYSGAWSNGDTGGAAWYNITTGGVVTLGACEGTGSARTIAAGTEFKVLATFILA